MDEKMTLDILFTPTPPPVLFGDTVAPLPKVRVLFEWPHKAHKSCAKHFRMKKLLIKCW